MAVQVPGAARLPEDNGLGLGLPPEAPNLPAVNAANVAHVLALPVLGAQPAAQQPPLDPAQAIAQLADVLKAGQLQQQQLFQVLSQGTHQASLQHTQLLQTMSQNQNAIVAKRFQIPAKNALTQHKNIPAIKQIERELLIFKESFGKISKRNFGGNNRDAYVEALTDETTLLLRFLNGENPAGKKRYTSKEDIPRDGRPDVNHIFEILPSKFLADYTTSKTQTQTLIENPDNCWAEFEGFKQEELKEDFKKFNEKLESDYLKLLGEVTDACHVCYKRANIPFELRYPTIKPPTPRRRIDCGTLAVDTLTLPFRSLAPSLWLGLNTLEYAVENPIVLPKGGLAAIAGVSMAGQALGRISPKEFLANPHTLMHAPAQVLNNVWNMVKPSLEKQISTVSKAVQNGSYDLIKTANAYKHLTPFVSAGAIAGLSVLVTQSAFKVSKCLGYLTMAGGAVASSLPFAVPYLLEPGMMQETVKEFGAIALSNAEYLAVERPELGVALAASIATVAALQKNYPKVAVGSGSVAALCGKTILGNLAQYGAEIVPSIWNGIFNYPYVSGIAATVGVPVVGYKGYKYATEKYEKLSDDKKETLRKTREGCLKVASSIRPIERIKKAPGQISAAAASNKAMPIAGAVGAVAATGILGAVASPLLFVSSTAFLGHKFVRWACGQRQKPAPLSV